jgi:parvulin-like peptidyl-prolyl isomerase
MESQRGTILLAAGAAAGILLAASGLIASSGDGGSLAPGTIATVNGEPIAREEYDRTLAALAGDRRGGIGDKERRWVLDRLIDEELLVQRGLELGLARRDAKVRADLTAAVVASAVAARGDVAPTPAAVRAYYDQNRDFFTRPGRVRARQILCRVRNDEDAPAFARAREAAARLRAGEEFAAVRTALGDGEIAPLPDAPLPPTTLREYLGPTPLRTLLELPLGAVSEPVRSSAGYHVLLMLERQPDETPPFEEITAEVEAELRRWTGEEALRAYLDGLRARAQVEIGPLP